MIRDESLTEPVFYSSTTDKPHTQWYGYEWSQPVEVRRMGLYVGFPREEWGWLVDPVVQYRSEAGVWVTAKDMTITPDFPEGQSKYLQPGFVQYDFRFEPVETSAVRVVAQAGGDPVDGPPTYGTAVSELSVHAR